MCVPLVGFGKGYFILWGDNMNELWFSETFMINVSNLFEIALMVIILIVLIASAIYIVCRLGDL